MNHIDIGKTSSDEVAFDSTGLRATNAGNTKLVLLAANPLGMCERYYWSVTVNLCCEIDIGVTTLWEGRNLIQYIWSYLEVGVIQQGMLPEGSKNSEGRKEKLNSYEYAADEIASFSVEPFDTGDTLSVFCDTSTQVLSFFKNGALQHSFTKFLSPSTASPVGRDVTPNDRQTVSRRNRRGRPILPSQSSLEPGLESGSPTSGCSSVSSPVLFGRRSTPDSPQFTGQREGSSCCSSSSPIRPSRARPLSPCNPGVPSCVSPTSGSQLEVRSTSPLSGLSADTTEDAFRRAPVREAPSSVIFPAVALGGKNDGIAFSFEPPPWSVHTHRFYPLWFTPILRCLLCALERKPLKLNRELVMDILSWVGVGYSRIVIPTLG
jgi:hypothetical protein